MKKFFAIAITLMMVLSLGVFAADYEVDIASITDASDDVVVDFTDAGYTGKVIKFTNGTGLNANLGAIDLSLYSKVVFTYGSDPGAYYDTADSVYLEDAEGNMIGSFAPSAPTGFWASMERQSEIAIDTEYNGDVIVVSGLSGHGIAISSIVFVEASAETEAPATEAPATEAPATDAATEAPATTSAVTNATTNAVTNATTNATTNAAGTDDGEGGSIVPIIVIVAVVVVAAVAAVVIMKKKK